jgi:predicted phosphoribosyltransferase
MNDDVLALTRVRPTDVDRIAVREAAEIARREGMYRGGHQAASLEGKTVILVDDGLATGATMRAAARAIRLQHPARLVVAVPVAAASTCEDLRQEADAVICLNTPDPFYAVGLWYDDFSQVTDDEVRGLLARSPLPSSSGG